jgi:hypothetical protein
MHIRIDYAEPKTKIQAEQIQWVFEGPQMSSYEDANILFESRQAPVHLTNAHVFYFNALIYVLLCLWIKLIGVVWHRSCIKIDLHVYHC